MKDNVLQHNIDGLNIKLQALREQEKNIARLQGIDETIAVAKRRVSNLGDEIAGVREEIGMLQDERAMAISDTADALAKKMNAVLPFGKAVFDVNDSGVFIGWQLRDDNVVGYHGLSGGQRVMFDAAFAFAMDADVLIVEAAELDDDNLKNALDNLAKIDRQVIVNTCHQPQFDVDAQWNVKEF